ncbi:hypothetical protein C7B77_21650 [Chamaesiphon polymorphus CCALA 037]|uniref:Uncharacterized protein n=2 Tax=Chamaesiphon TaxID=217161 RepID=A0A2T1G2D1_9CYAN|nr:hypothetical protein C7B77_21650 [Chamaesiphon polymorphus CCALA 037]
MPEDALTEAAKELESINDFYQDRAALYVENHSQSSRLSASSSVNIKGILKQTQVRQPIVLES